MSERGKTIATKINHRVLLQNNKTSRQDEDYITNQTDKQAISACKFKKINPVPKPQSSALGANILNNIKTVDLCSSKHNRRRKRYKQH